MHKSIGELYGEPRRIFLIICNMFPERCHVDIVMRSVRWFMILNDWKTAFSKMSIRCFITADVFQILQTYLCYLDYISIQWILTCRCIHLNFPHIFPFCCFFGFYLLCIYKYLSVGLSVFGTVNIILRESALLN